MINKCTIFDGPHNNGGEQQKKALSFASRRHLHDEFSSVPQTNANIEFIVLSMLMRLSRADSDGRPTTKDDLGLMEGDYLATTTQP